MISRLFQNVAARASLRRDERLRRHARAMMKKAAAADPTARLLDWNADNGGVGRIAYPLGTLQMRIEKGIHEIEWCGHGSHQTRYERHDMMDIASMLAILRQWTSRHFVNARATDAGPHHFLI